MMRQSNKKNKASQTVDHVLNNRRGGILKTIKQQYNEIQKAEQVLVSFDVPYFTYSTVCFYDGKKLLLKTSIPELKSKIRILHHDLIQLLQTHPYFQTIKQINVILAFDPPEKPRNISKAPSQSANAALNYLEGRAEDPKIKQSLQKLIEKYYGK